MEQPDRKGRSDSEGIDQPQPEIKLGRIDYTNVWPIFHFFDTARFGTSVAVERGVPTELNRKLHEGSLDMSAVSSFTYGQNPEDYVLLPDLSVSCFGPVRSILLFHKEPLEDIVNGKIALTTSSATSVNLLKVIFERFLGGRPLYNFAKPRLDDMMKEADGALLIGDDAIQASWMHSHPDSPYRITDLGALWQRFTGSSMTFAVWAVRKESAERYPDRIAQIRSAFMDSKRHAASRIDELATSAIDRFGGEKEYWTGYFTNLTYDFGQEQQEGLQRFYNYAYELGLLDNPVNLEIWQEANK